VALGGLDVHPAETKSSEYDWSEIEKPVADGFQKYVLVAHGILGIIISVLSFSGNWISWTVGLGAMTPVLLAVTGLFYTIATGMNWYRDELIPYLTRVQTIPEFETDRFLNYNRIKRIFMLLSGYVALVITQYVWTQILNFVLSFSGDFDNLLELLGMIFSGMLFLHVILTIIIIAIFDVVLRSVFSDIRYIIDIEDKMTAYFNEKKKLEKEEKSKLKNEIDEDGEEPESEILDE
jgi:uncharacterized membrane protein